LFIDGRLNAEKFQVISITGEDYYNMKKYIKEFLFADTAVTDALCSYKQTTYCAAMIASLMCNVFVNFMCNSDARPVIFFQEYDAEIMSLKQEM
jgi:pyoverdine/dityrosine biosynthesis protein Dit1